MAGILNRGTQVHKVKTKYKRKKYKYLEKNSEESNRFSDWLFTPIDFFFIGEKLIIYLINYINNHTQNYLFFEWVYSLSKAQNKSEFLRIYFYLLWDFGIIYAWLLKFWFILIWFEIYKIILIYSDCLCFSLIYLFFSVWSQKCL